MQQLQMMKMGGMVPWTGNQMTQMQYEMSAFARFKEQSMKALKQQEIDALNEIEKEIELELNSIEGQLKTKRAMKESCQSLLKEQVQDYVPKFGLG
jgi:DNA-binding transcriptional regulator GbsR (MarR family)